MEVKQIVVDMLPKDCSHCKLSGVTERNKWFCGIMSFRTIGIEPRCPSWCPLQIEDECLSTIFEQNYQTSDGKWESAYRCRTGCGVQQKISSTHCHDCGKRIRYEEE